MTQDQTFEEIVIGQETVRLEHRDVPTVRIDLYKENPRLKYMMEKESGKSPEDFIKGLPDAAKLRKDIETNGGLRERVVLIQVGERFVAAEGNRRRVAYGELAAKHPDDDRWQAMPARILPVDIDPKKVATLLADMHVANKVRWGAHEKAGHIYHMNKTLGIPLDEIAITLHASKTTVSRFLNAYAFMKDEFLTIDEGAYKDQGEGAWSFFDELHRSKELKTHLKDDPEFGDSFCRWVGDGRLGKGEQVRRLAKILGHPDARKVFESEPPATAFSTAYKVVEAKEPEAGSDFFKMLAKVKDACSSAAQVREILRIRTDPVARKRVMETYQALVDFMQLADVEVPGESRREREAA